MPEKIPAPKLSAPDPEGFRTFSFETPEVGETFRVSFNLARLRDYVAITAGDPEKYLPLEYERLRLGAAILAAKDDFPNNDRDGALETILNLTPKFAGEVLERFFPSLALLALSAASDVCVKHTINRIVQSLHAPKVYDEAFIQKVFEEFVQYAKILLEISPGRPFETPDHVNKVREALLELATSGKLTGSRRPTQKLISAQLGS